jgi:molybdenum cofactor synthesis domain-containing protein
MATESVTNPARSNAGIIIASDRAALGQYEDKSGPAIRAWIQSRTFLVAGRFSLVADVSESIAGMVSALLSDHDLIIVSGGTGLGPRDVTPQAIESLADYSIPGIGELLRNRSEKFSANSYLSRCGAWVKHQKLILAVPGNPKAVTEQLDILEDLLPHILMSLRGECKHRRRVDPE